MRPRTTLAGTMLTVSRFGRPLVVAALAATALGSALASEALQIVAGPQTERLDVTYDCGPAGAVPVTYFDAEPDFLALVPVNGRTRIFVGVVSASGAKYVAGEWAWWTEGTQAMLLSTLSGNGGEPTMRCEESR